MYKLLTKPSANAKTAKAINYNYYNVILHLAPSGLSGVNQCPFASKGCIQSCLNTAGRGKFNNVQTARIRRTQMMLNNPEQFEALLIADIKKAIKYAAKQGLKLAVRLDGTSDRYWNHIIELFPDVQFYDYTKDVAKALNNKLPNYYLTFSRSESNAYEVSQAINAGINIAVVFDQVPATYMGLTVIDGDQNDLRFMDPKNVVIGLKAKGRAKKDTTGFTVRMK
jgi:hypothetical protein